ncbi:hypothetical protein [Microbulbifer halophilus]
MNSRPFLFPQVDGHSAVHLRPHGFASNVDRFRLAVISSPVYSSLHPQ